MQTPVHFLNPKNVFETMIPLDLQGATPKPPQTQHIHTGYVHRTRPIIPGEFPDHRRNSRGCLLYCPETIPVCGMLIKERPACTLVEASGVFVLNVLGQDDSSLLKRFSKPPEGDSIFEGLSVQRSNRSIVLLNDAVSYLECELINQTAVQDHLIYIGKVVEGNLLKGGEPYVHIRKNRTQLLNEYMQNTNLPCGKENNRFSSG